MTDVHDKKTRSYNMSQIKATNIKPELLVRKFLHASGFRYKLYDRTQPGKPDIVLPLRTSKPVVLKHYFIAFGNIYTAATPPHP